MSNSVELINKHGRRVAVLKHREKSLLQQGFTKAPPADAPAKKAAPVEPPPAKEEELTLEQFEGTLVRMTKGELAAYALDGYGLTLNTDDLTKDKMIAAIIEAATTVG